MRIKITEIEADALRSLRIVTLIDDDFCMFGRTEHG